MQKINIRKTLYAIRHSYLTLNNVVIAVAFVIAASWVWGALEMMQRNYSLQKEVDTKRRVLQLTELQRDSLALQKRYYQTNEYQELAVRESLGLVMPGEKMLILPKNTSDATSVEDSDETLVTTTNTPSRTSHFEQWLNFLFGGNSRSIDTTSDS